MELLTQITDIVGKDNVFANEPMNIHTTFKAGGNAKYYVTPENEESLAELIKVCPRYFVIGRGSNLLVSDEGYDGVIIEIGSKFICGYDIKSSDGIDVNADEFKMTVSAGARLSDISRKAAEYSFTGHEFAQGIPGNLGGAIVMNAGAYGGEMIDVIERVRLLTPEGNAIEESVDKLDLSYRHSNIPERNLTVLGAVLRLKPGEKKAIEEKMSDLAARRREKQPLEYPSAGSTFKRPEGYFAGALIEQAGMKGYRIGNAQVSEKHAGFVVNLGGATATDIIKVIEDVQEQVFKTSGVRLQTEVKVL